MYVNENEMFGRGFLHENASITENEEPGLL
jgi:hypothetical protein